MTRTTRNRLVRTFQCLTVIGCGVAASVLEHTTLIIG